MSAPPRRARGWAAELALLLPAAVLAAMAGRAPPPAPAAAAPRVLRVCTHGTDAPAADARGHGVDAAVGALVARELGAELRFSRPRGRGVPRVSGACDVLMGVTAPHGPLLATRPYYHSAPLALDVAMGVRSGDVALKRTLDAVLARRRPQVDSIVAAHGVRGVARPQR